MPYRDGVGAARAAIEPELDELRERAEELSGLGNDVPAGLRVEIDGLFADASRPARSMRDVETAELRMRELALALDVAGEAAAMTVATRRAKWRARLRFVLIAGGMLGIVGGAFAASTHDVYAERRCRQSYECQEQGLCHVDLERKLMDGWISCVAENNADCAGACKRRGACTAQDGRCVATSDSTCFESDLCRSDGACSAGEDGSCVAAADADCAASKACRESGRCSADAKSGTCAVEHDSDCAASRLCAEDSLCAEWGGRCVTQQEKTCRDGQACKDSGRCTPVAEGCTAKDDGDCQFSDACLEHDRCTAKNGVCVRR